VVYQTADWSHSMLVGIQLSEQVLLKFIKA
jgi:hypothetical protein